jgi:hypothetical protein
MLASKVACPHCRASLTSTRPLSVGVKVKCLKCGAPFRIAGNAAGQVYTAAADTVVSANTELDVPAPRPVLVRRRRPPQKSSVLPFLIAGLFVLGGAAGIWLYFYALGKNPTSAENKAAAPGKGAGAVRASRTVAPEGPAIPVAEAEQGKILQAIRAGVAFLKKTQSPQGTWTGLDYPVGMAALGGLTLLECGVEVNDPAVQKAVRYVRKNCKDLLNTYELSMAILFLDRLDESSDQPLIRSLALRLVAGQTAAGGWGYNCVALNSGDEEQLAKVLKEIRPGEAVDALNPRIEKVKTRAEDLTPIVKNAAVLQDPAKLHGPALKEGRDDNSNTQFAILALWAARRHDVAPERTLLLIVKRFRDTQNTDGSWIYSVQREQESKYPTMTCAGLLGLAVGHGLGNEDRAQGKKLAGAGRQPVAPAEDDAVKRALRHVALAIGEPVRRTQDIPMMDLYYLWSIERVALLYNLPKIEGKDWYTWGMEILLANQSAHGGWMQGGGYPGGNSPMINTCFALLFLKRANLAQDLTSKLKLFDEPTAPKLSGNKDLK